MIDEQVKQDAVDATDFATDRIGLSLTREPAATAIFAGAIVIASAIGRAARKLSPLGPEFGPR